jgi:hypothetical protein
LTIFEYPIARTENTKLAIMSSWLDLGSDLI